MRMKRLICFIFTTLLLVSTTAFGEPTASDTTIARAKKLAQAITEISMAYHGRFVDSAVANLLDTNPAARPKWPTTNTIRAILPKDAGGAELLSISETGLGVNRENDGWLLVVPNQKYANPNEARIASHLLPLASYNEGTNTIRVPLIRPAAASTLGYIMEYVKVILSKRDGLGLDGTTATPTFHAGSSMILGNNSVLDVREADGIQFALTNAEIEGVGIIGRNANSRINFETGEVVIDGDLRMTGRIYGQDLQLSGNLTKTGGTLSVHDAVINGDLTLPASATLTPSGNVVIENEIRSVAGSTTIQGQLQTDKITASTNARFDTRPSVEGRTGAASGTAWNKYATNAVNATTADVIAWSANFADLVTESGREMYCYYTYYSYNCTRTEWRTRQVYTGEKCVACKVEVDSSGGSSSLATTIAAINYYNAYDSETNCRNAWIQILNDHRQKHERIMNSQPVCYPGVGDTPGKLWTIYGSLTSTYFVQGSACNAIVSSYTQYKQVCTRMEAQYTTESYTVEVPDICYAYGGDSRNTSGCPTNPTSFISNTTKCTHLGGNRYRCKKHLL